MNRHTADWLSEGSHMSALHHIQGVSYAMEALVSARICLCLPRRYLRPGRNPTVASSARAAGFVERMRTDRFHGGIRL